MANLHYFALQLVILPGHISGPVLPNMVSISLNCISFPDCIYNPRDRLFNRRGNNIDLAEVMAEAHELHDQPHQRTLVVYVNMCDANGVPTPDKYVWRKSAHVKWSLFQTGIVVFQSRWTHILRDYLPLETIFLLYSVAFLDRHDLVESAKICMGAIHCVINLPRPMRKTGTLVVLVLLSRGGLLESFMMIFITSSSVCLSFIISHLFTAHKQADWVFKEERTLQHETEPCSQGIDIGHMVHQSTSLVSYRWRWCKIKPASVDYHWSRHKWYPKRIDVKVRVIFNAGST